MKAARTLIFSDTFRLARIINMAGITAYEINDLLNSRNFELAEIRKIENEEEKAIRLSDLQTEAGLEMVSYIIQKAPTAEKEINRFLAAIAGAENENEIANAPVTEIAELIKDIFDKNADIKDFFIRGLRSAKVVPLTKS